MLVEELDLHAGVHQSAHDVADRVMPLIRAVRHGSSGLGVSPV
jgi:hypothetical protein